MFFSSGKYSNLSPIDLQRKIHNEYGDLVKLPLPSILGKGDLLCISNPTLVEKVFRKEGVAPLRRGIDTFGHYRKKIRPEVYSGRAGLIADQGQAWLSMRTTANTVIMQQKNVDLYVPAVDEVAREFVAKINKLRDYNNEMPDNFSNKLSEWALESIGTIALGQRLGVMEETPEGKQIIKVTMKSNKCNCYFLNIFFML